MSREVFLTIVAGVAVCIGGFAAALPRLLLDSKGVAPNAATNVWVREVGVLIVQLGLLPIEVVAYARGVITKRSGIVPNTVLHVVLAAGFAFYAAAMS